MSDSTETPTPPDEAGHREPSPVPLLAALQPIRDFAATLATALQEQQRAFTEAFRPLIELLRATADAQPTVIPYLLERGWYVTMKFPLNLFPRLDTLQQEKNHDEADALICHFVRGQVDEVEGELSDCFPDRAGILADAFSAHRDGKFSLSIPVFIAQSDAIGCELLGVPRQFFSQRSRSAALKQRLEAFVSIGPPYVLLHAWEEVLSQLGQRSSIEVDTDVRAKQRKEDGSFGPLNRHGVLHGLDTDYATEANSLRCVLLLRYLLDVDRLLREEIPEDVAEWNRTWKDLLTAGGQVDGLAR